MISRLRLLGPVRRRAAVSNRGVFAWVVVALLLQFFLTKNLLVGVLGYDVNLRVHPANFILLGCALYCLAVGDVPFYQRCKQAPVLVLFFVAIPLIAAYSVFNNGVSGVAVYFDSFWAPALLAVALQGTTDKQRRTLAKILLAIVVLNVVVGLYESLIQDNWFPFVDAPDDDAPAAAVQPVVEDFRANAFYSHPLSASLATAMGFFLLYVMPYGMVVRAGLYLLMLLGLLAFGGRTALTVTLACSVLSAGYLLIVGILRRNLKLSFAVMIVAAVVLVPLVVGVVVTQTSIADRIIDTLYYDDSAAARVTQWDILRYLTLRNWLFGIPLDALIDLKYQIGLGSTMSDIENFWLLIFLNLGLLGFVPFVIVFGLFLRQIAQFGHGMFAYLLVIAALVIDSGSNSLGTKSNDLVLEVAFLFAMAGYWRAAVVPFAAQRSVKRAVALMRSAA